MELVEVDGELSGLIRGDVAFRIDGDVRMVTLVSEEEGYTCGGARSVVVGELGERKETGPVGLLIVAVAADVLFQCLIRTLRLTISFRVITRSEMEDHPQGDSETSEEAGDEFGAPVVSNMSWDTVLGEDVNDEEFGKFLRGDSAVAGNEDRLLGKAIDDNKDGVVTVGGRKGFNEVHGDGVPGALRNRKLLEEAVRFMTGGLGATARSAGGAVVFDE